MITETREFPAYKMGIVLAKHGEFSEAMHKFREVLACYPRAILDVLVPLYRQLALEPENMALRVFIADIYVAGRMYEDAVNELEEIVHLSPSFSSAYGVLSKLYKKSKDPDRIKAIFEYAFAQDIFDSALLDVLPGIYLEEKNITKSIRIYEKLVEVYPKALHHAKTLAGLYEREEMYEKATDLYESIALRSPSCVGEAAVFCERISHIVPESFSIRKRVIQLHMKGCNPVQAAGHVEAMLAVDDAYITEAIETYKKILELYPETVEVLYTMGKSLVQVGRYSEAVTYLRKVFEAAPSDSEKVSVLLQTVLTHYPNQLMALQLLADIHIYQDHYLEAWPFIVKASSLDGSEDYPLETLLEKVIQNEPRLAKEAQEQLLRYYFNQSAYLKCIEFGKKLLKTPFAHTAGVLMSQSYAELGHLEMAMTILDTAMETAPWHADVHDQFSKISERRRVDSLNFGVMALAKGHLETALEWFQKELPESPAYLEAQFYLNRCFVEMGRLDLALSQGSRLISDVPLSEEWKQVFMFLSGVQRLHAGEVTEGLTVLEAIYRQNMQFPFVKPILSHYQQESVVDLRGKVISGSVYQGHLLLKTVRNRDRLGVKSPGFQPMGFAYSHNTHGIDHMLKGHYQSAQDEFLLALDMDPELTGAYCNLGMAYLAQDELTLACAQFEKAKQLNPKLDLVYLNMGLLAMQACEFQTAFEHFTQALTLHPSPLALLNLGDAHRALGQIKPAFAYWKKALATGMMYPYSHRRMTYAMDDIFWKSDPKQQAFLTPDAFLPSSLLR